MKPHWRIQPGQVKLLNVAITELQRLGVAITKAQIKDRFGVESTKELTVAQFDEAMRFFTACGFVYRPKVKKAPVIRAQKRVKQVYLVAINKALEELGKDWAYAEGIAKQMFHLDKVVWQWLSPEQLHKVQIALIYEERKQAGDPVERKPETLARRAKGRQAGTPAPPRGRNVGQEI